MRGARFGIALGIGFLTIAFCPTRESFLAHAAPPVAPRSAKLKWQMVDGAEKYDLQVSRSSDMTKPVFNKRLDETSAQFPVPPGIYYYRIRGVDSEGSPGPWSDVEAFAVNPRPPNPLLPADKADFKGPLPSDGLSFKWEKGLGSSKYRIEIRDREGILVDRVLEDEEFLWSPPAPGVFRWRVGYENPTGVEWGVSRLFRVQDGAVSLPPELAQKVKDMSPQNRAVDTGGEASFYAIVRPGVGMAMYSLAIDPDGSGPSGAQWTDEETNLGSFLNLELRWRAARAAQTPWLLSGSFNAELMGVSVNDKAFYLPTLFTRVFYTHRQPSSSWRIGPFVHLQYGAGIVAGVTSFTGGPNVYVGQVNRASGGVGGVGILQIGSSNFLSVLALARYDLGSSNLTERDTGAPVAGTLRSGLGAEFGLGVLFSLSPRLIAESRLRVNIMNSETAGTASSSPDAVTRTTSSQVFIDLGLGYQL